MDVAFSRFLTIDQMTKQRQEMCSDSLTYLKWFEINLAYDRYYKKAKYTCLVGEDSLTLGTSILNSI